MFRKARSHLKILNCRHLPTWGKFPTADPQILGAKVRNLFARDLYTPDLRLGDAETVVCCSAFRNIPVRTGRSMEDSGEHLLTVPVHMTARCFVF